MSSDPKQKVLVREEVICRYGLTGTGAFTGKVFID